MILFYYFIIASMKSFFYYLQSDVLWKNLEFSGNFILKITDFFMEFYRYSRKFLEFYF